MIIARSDMKILDSDEVEQLKKRYEEKFGEWAPGFCYEDFPATEELSEVQCYMEAIKKAIEEGKPLKIETQYRKEFDEL